MTAVAINPTTSDDERRRALWDGVIHHWTPTAEVRAFGQLAWDMIAEAFAPHDPVTAQHELPVERFVEIIAPLKTGFTHSDEAKARLRDVLAAFGCDLGSTYFDLPKLRIVTSGGYLTAGAGYAYRPHRDVWYAAPPCQQNWWFPLTTVDATCALAFHPAYWERAVDNDSGGFDAYEWNRTGRRDAAKFVGADPRNHPHALASVAELGDIRLVGGPGAMTLFSGAHLHSTVPNTSGSTRFSIDFRTVHADDIVHRRGAHLVDASCTGTTLRDFLRASDLEPFAADTVAMYETGDVNPDAVVVFDPAVLDG